MLKDWDFARFFPSKFQCGIEVDTSSSSSSSNTGIYSNRDRRSSFDKRSDSDRDKRSSTDKDKRSGYDRKNYPDKNIFYFDKNRSSYDKDSNYEKNRQEKTDYDKEKSNCDRERSNYDKDKTNFNKINNNFDKSNFKDKYFDKTNFKERKNTNHRRIDSDSKMSNPFFRGFRRENSDFFPLSSRHSLIFVDRNVNPLRSSGIFNNRRGSDVITNKSSDEPVLTEFIKRTDSPSGSIDHKNRNSLNTPSGYIRSSSNHSIRNSGLNNRNISERGNEKNSNFDENEKVLNSEKHSNLERKSNADDSNLERIEQGSNLERALNEFTMQYGVLNSNRESRSSIVIQEDGFVKPRREKTESDIVLRYSEARRGLRESLEARRREVESRFAREVENMRRRSSRALDNVSITTATNSISGEEFLYQQVT